jgi:hypothetical protein
MTKELVMPLIGQTINFGKILAGYMSDVEDARYSHEAQIMPNV